MTENESSNVGEEEEEEFVDPLVKIREECGERHCEKLKALLDACNERVLSRGKTAEVCHEEVIDYMHCVDHCLPLDPDSLTEAEKRERLARRKPTLRAAKDEELEDSFDLNRYSFMWNKKT